ncbi:Rdx family protein [Pseudalkalibacillus hwajinpoensis]
MGSLELIPSSGGAFEITVNEESMHSKLKTGQYPDVTHFIEKMEKMKM